MAGAGPSSTSHIGQFETLRGLAAMWVFVSHALRISEWPVPVLAKGDLAVDLFIILSGFVITLLVRRRAEPYPSYIFRRFMRLYPLFCVALFLGLLTEQFYAPVIGTSYWGDVWDTKLIGMKTAVETDFLPHLLLHLTMLHGMVPDTWLPRAALSFSGPLWSISLEWQFYLVAPFLVWALDIRRPGRLPWFLLALLVIAIGKVLALEHWRGEVSSFLPLRLDFFAIGILCGHWWDTARKASLLALLGGAGAFVLLFVPWMAGKIPLLLWTATYVIAAAGNRTAVTGAANHILNMPALRWIGERSYGIYVLHMPIMLAIAYYLVLPHAAVLGQAGVTLALLATAPLVITIAAIAYLWVEQPAIRWGKRVSADGVHFPSSVPALAAEPVNTSRIEG